MRAELAIEIGAAPPRETAWLSADERARLAAMRLPKRRNEFRRGRWLAKRVLARALGLPTDARTLGDLEIAADERGAPEARRRGVPLDCRVSISHRRSAALCAVAPAGPGVGCDVEWIEPRSRAFERHVLRDDERVWVEGLSPAERAGAANLIWSAKESVVKALGTGLDVDVRSLRLRLEPDRARRFEVTLPAEPAPLVGWWGRVGGFVWSVASRRPDEPGLQGLVPLGRA